MIKTANINESHHEIGAKIKITIKQPNTMTYLKEKDENHVKKGEMKEYLERFFKMKIEKKESIVEYMGKPLSNYDYNRIKIDVEEHEGKQTKIWPPEETTEEKEIRIKAELNKKHGK